MANPNGNKKTAEKPTKPTDTKSTESPKKPSPKDAKKEDINGEYVPSLTTMISLLVGIVATIAYVTRNTWYPGLVLTLEATIEATLGPEVAAYFPESILFDARTTEVAQLMGGIYASLVAMRYIDSKGITYGPHKLNGTKPSKNLSPAIVQLYQKLPYVDGPEAGNFDFLLGSEFADFRKPAEMKEARDPFQRSPSSKANSTNGRYVSPWQTPLTRVHGQGIILMYDVKTHRIWMLEPHSGVSADPELVGTANIGEQGINKNSFEHIPSRPADEVLRDYRKWLAELRYIPGNGENSKFEGLYDYYALKNLYIEHGWPMFFKGDKFEIARARWYAGERAKHNGNEPVREADKFALWKKAAERDLQARQNEVAAAEELNEEWIAKWELFKLGGIYGKILSDLAEAEEEATRLCPDRTCYKEEDLPLWEAEQLRAEIETKTAQMKAYENMLVQMRNESIPAENRPTPAQLNDHIAMMRHARREISITEKAYTESRAAADNAKPGVSFEQATGLKSLQRRTIDLEIAQGRKAVDWANEQMEAHSQWDQNETPQDEETKAKLGVFRQRVDDDMGALIRQQAGLKAHWDRARKWKKDHVDGEQDEAETGEGEAEDGEAKIEVLDAKPLDE